MKLFSAAILIGAFCSASTPSPSSPGRANEIDKKLEEAFGQEFNIVRTAKIKLKLAASDEAYVFACDTMEVIDARTVKLTPGNYALFVKSRDKTEMIASSVGKAPSVVLTFDRPVTTFESMGKAKLETMYWPMVIVRGVGK